ncbi:MAG: aconitase X catalytic domain-containing protein [Actinobacteria bacterium]|nr:aconitase X catalytic domain-containing protein [Actinomycetota bacterium]
MPELSEADRALWSGEAGEGPRMAMRVVLALARAVGAERLIDVTSAHVDGCLYHGEVSLDFALRLLDGGARVAVPTTLNVGAVDLLHPDLYRGDPETGRRARRLMEAYTEMGCRPTFTCAPYQVAEARPGFGEHVAWAESNAIVFANSVLGARTDRYGDFIDACAAVTGRVPDAGLHRTEARRARAVFRLEGIPDRLLDEDVLYPVLGHLVGREAGTLVPAMVGLPPGTSEDRLKALGAAAASSGAVALFHAVGVTPEAPTLEAALQGRPPERELAVTPSAVARARDELSTSAGPAITAVSLGTPHSSPAELERLAGLLDGHGVHPDVELYVSTGRGVLAEAGARGWIAALEGAGARVVVDTCTYVTPIIRRPGGTVMTNSGKWAWYAPGNLGVDVVFGSLEECVTSAIRGEVWRDRGLWAGI